MPQFTYTYIYIYIYIYIKCYTNIDMHIYYIQVYITLYALLFEYELSETFCYNFVILQFLQIFYGNFLSSEKKKNIYAFK